jgi:hypothetical protein
MAYQMDEKLYTFVISLLSAFLGGSITLAGQYLNNRQKIKEINLQLIHKIAQEELAEKKAIIKPLLEYFRSLVLPLHGSFHNEEDVVQRNIIDSTDEIKKNISDFLVDYILYINDDIQNAIWQVYSSATSLEELSARCYDHDLDSFENFEKLFMNSGDKPDIIWRDIESLTKLLRKEVDISEKLKLR